MSVGPAPRRVGPPRLGRAAAFLSMAMLFGTVASSSAAGAGPQWVVLNAGQLGDYAWTVKAKRLGGGTEAGSQRAARPCVLVGTRWQIGPYDLRRTRYRQCAETRGPLSPRSPPLIASGGPPSVEPRPMLTAVGMLVASAVRRVRITFADGSSTTVRAERLAPALRQRTGLSRLRYAAFSVRGTWCAERVVSLSATGRVLWDSGTDDLRCSANGSPT